jgi:hypothetical protein
VSGAVVPAKSSGGVAVRARRELVPTRSLCGGERRGHRHPSASQPTDGVGRRGNVGGEGSCTHDCHFEAVKDALGLPELPQAGAQ